MAFFIPQTIQKRLLRYALSRLELLDTDALDLDRLDIGWGRRSTIELRDVAVHTNKLASLLHLPDHVHVETASIAALRVTVPADIYTSSIVISVSHVQTTLRVLEANGEPDKSSRQQHDPKATQPATARASRSPLSGQPHTSTGFQDDFEEGDVLPTPQDLAKSFLEQEPPQEKAQLEAEINSQSTTLHKSTSSSSETDDEGLGYGTGIGLNLPTFLAGFLTGISDRLQVQVEDVSVRVITQLDGPAWGALSSTQTRNSEPAALVLKLRKVDVEEFTSQSPSEAPVETFSPTEPRQVLRVGHRNIILHGISAAIEATAESFDNFSRTLTSKGEEKNPESPIHSWTGTTKDSAIQQTHQEPSTVSAEIHPSTSPRPSSDDENETSSASPPAYMRASFISSEGGNVADAEDSDDNMTTRRRFRLRRGSHESPWADSSSSMGDASSTHDILQSFRNERSGPKTRSSFKISHSSARPAWSSPTSASNQLGSSPEDLRTSGPLATSDNELTPTGEEPTFQEAFGGFERSPQRTSSVESLTESRLFTHEDAESIYMSMAEEPQNPGPDRRSTQQHVPGGWGDVSEAEPSILARTRGSIQKDDLPPEQSSGSQSLSASDIGPLQTLASDDETLKSSQKKTNENEIAHRTILQEAGVANTVQRTICIIDRIVLGLPKNEIAGDGPTEGKGSLQNDAVAEAAEASLSKPSRESMPGAFSLYAESAATGSSGLSPSTTNFAINTEPSTTETATNAKLGTTPLTVLVDAIDMNADIGTCGATMQLIRNLTNAVVPQNEKTPFKARTDKAAALQTPPISLKLNKISLAVYADGGDVSQAAHLTDSLQRGSKDSVQAVPFPLVAAKLTGVSLSMKATQQTRTSELGVGRLSIKIAQQDSILFSREATLRSSIRDVQTEAGTDITVKYFQGHDHSLLEVSTLPIMLNLDMHRMDETLASFGGFSGLLEAGSSMFSESPTVSPSSPLSASRTRPRAVHFEPSVNNPRSLDQKVSLKVNMRIAGSTVNLQTMRCGLTYRSSAIKVVCRDTLVGVQIDDMRLEGPQTHHVNKNQGLTARVKNFGLKFLTHPEERDLTRLISLLTPSNNAFEEDDDFLVDTLVRQRKKGSALRLTVTEVDIIVPTTDSMTAVTQFGEDLSKLANVTKYLPEESRPGMMTLGLVHDLRVSLMETPGLGKLQSDLAYVEFAHVGTPSLLAANMGSLTARRLDDEVLIHPVLPQDSASQQPMIRARMIGDELEPTVKLRLYNTCFEYSVELIVDLLGSDGSQNKVQTNIKAPPYVSGPNGQSEIKLPAATEQSPGQSIAALQFDIVLQDCAIGMTPRGSPSKGMLVLTNTNLKGGLPEHGKFDLAVEVRKAAMLLVDDSTRLTPRREDRLHAGNRVSPIDALCRQGYVSVSWISAASAKIQSVPASKTEVQSLNVEFQDELFVLETCADSTQTLVELLNALKPPSPPAMGQKYRTEIAPVQDMLASFTGDAFAVAPAREETPAAYSDYMDLEDDVEDDEFHDNFDDLAMMTNEDQDLQSDAAEESMLGPASINLGESLIKPTNDFIEANREKLQASTVMAGGLRPTALPLQVFGAASKWNSNNNRYVPVTRAELSQCPFRFRITNMHIIWNMHDGYDWQKTRDTITRAVEDVQAKSDEQRNRRRVALKEEEEDDPVIGDFLFNSIYIGVPVNHDPRELTRQINRNVDEAISETASQATTTTVRTPSISHPSRPRNRKLRLERSKRHKLTFELRGISVDMFTFPPGEETVSSTDVRVKDLEIFDHVPTSTWKKFATYMHDAGPREDKKPMVHLEICDVKPVPDLVASELVIRVTVLPLRLHVDQDALDFMTRFFDFHDDEQPASAPSEQPYLQRVEVRPVPVKLDYKPKKVDFAGLRSGRTTEFMNFFNLDGADMVMKHAVIYGCPSFARLHKSLEDIWMPDIKNNQLPSVLSGLNGVRTLVNVGSGVRNLVVVPVREYQKDGRVVRSISKGALSFARTTGSELTRFGAKLAVGAQNVLQGAEGYLAEPSRGAEDGDWETADLDPDERRAISHYADQPAGILQGLKGAARSLERDLLVTRDMIIAVSGEARESGTVEGAARAVARNAPTLILRPMIGASKAISQTLMGATNTVDPQNRRRVEDKYKRY